jgi:hypothetical protein
MAGAKKRLTKPGSKKRSNRFAVHVARICWQLLAVSRSECQIEPAAVTLKHFAMQFEAVSRRGLIQNRVSQLGASRWTAQPTALPAINHEVANSGRGGKQTENARRAANPTGVLV